MNPNLIFICGVVGVFAVSNICENMVDRAALDLDRTVRDNITRRQALTFRWWRMPDIAGVSMLIAGILKMMGALPAITQYQWGIPCMTLGLVIICVASIVRAWLLNHAFAIEAPNTPASRSAFNSALIVSVAELLLAVGVSGYVLTHLPHKSSRPSQPPAVQSSAPAEKSAESPENSLWVDQAQALKMLPGKDANYLELLVKTKRVRMAKDGRKIYRRDDIETELPALPSLEDLKLNLENQNKAAPVETPPPEKPAHKTEKTEPLKE